MTVLNERISILLESLNIKKTEFAKRLNVSQAFISQICSGSKQPSDRTVADICREFNVNENWLRNGEGDMFLPADRNTEIARLTRQLLDEESDSFKNRLISVLSNLTADQWELLADIAENLTQKKD